MEKRFANIRLLDTPYTADSLYIYYINPEHREPIRIGSMVLIPFGNGNREVLGVVTGFVEVCPFPKYKNVLSIIDSGVDIDESMIGLCEFIKRRTYCTFGSALRAMIPKGLSVKMTERYTATGNKENMREDDTEIYDYIASFGTSGTERGDIIKKIGGNTAEALLRLSDSGCVIKKYEIIRRQNEKYIKYCTLAIDAQTAAKYLDGVLKASKQRQNLICALQSGEPLLLTELEDDYGIGMSVIKSAAKDNIIEIGQYQARREFYKLESGGAEAMPLTHKQSLVLDMIKELLDQKKAAAALLFGVTGSGKTRVITEAVQNVIERNKTAIILIPEIGLTAQAADIYKRVFGSAAIIIHSMLSEGERADAYSLAAAGKIKVIIGTRSAVFAPLKNIGLIVIDEEQEHTYKSEKSPKYHARDVAKYRCAKENALLLLASATPSVESFHKAQNGVYTLIELDERASAVRMPHTVIEDIRGDDRISSMKLLGERLSSEMLTAKRSKTQTILFMGRRGYNAFLSCQDCGGVITCPNCSVSLTHHIYSGAYSKNEKLVCHYCGYTVPVYKTCPTCQGSHIGFFGQGTQKLQEEIENDFPEISAVRMDTDTTGEKYSHDTILKDFGDNSYDCLFGTHMVTKGLDFPNVSLVGMVNADAMLYMNDFRAAERTFSLVTQLIGRAGRADTQGLAIIQTMNPEHPVLKIAATQDYRKFYEDEILLRRHVIFPPFCEIAALSFSGEDENALCEFGNVARAECDRIELKLGDNKVIRLGPYRQAIYKVNGKYRMHIVYKFKESKAIRAFFDELYRALLKKTPQNLKTDIDINPSTI